MTHFLDFHRSYIDRKCLSAPVQRVDRCRHVDVPAARATHILYKARAARLFVSYSMQKNIPMRGGSGW